jgi:hypothetical protein
VATGPTARGSSAAISAATRGRSIRSSRPCRQYGLAVDNLLEADVVLADGKFVTTSATEHPDLFWALRGGGGNFGVVTSFVFRTHPAKMLYGGPIVFDIADAPTVMRWYRQFERQAPQDFYIWLGQGTRRKMGEIRALS